MPRQVDNTPVSRPAKRRRDVADPAGGQSQGKDGVAGSSTPQSTSAAPPRKRAREDDSGRRPRSPLKSGQRPTGSADAPSPPRSPARSPPRKRPGASSRIDAAARRQAEQLRQQKEDEDRKAIAARKNDDLVSAHYNNVPQKGRDWRNTESQIKGLRSFNNWVKSALIQKFSVPDIPPPQLLVLDIGCGKGGDLQKWQNAPQMPALYVGIDPADVSIEQARGRYDEMLRRRKHPRAPPPRIYDAQFLAQDAFGRSLAGVPIIQQVGFDPNAGPGNGNIGGRFMRGGFDVISMMFCLHYAYETEDKARGMLKNIAGALKKGGRLIGVMPDSAVISAHVVKHLKGSIQERVQKEEKSIYDDETWDPEKPSSKAEDDWDPTKPAEGETANDDDDWDPEKPIAGGSDNWDPEKPAAEQDDNWDPEAPSEAPAQLGTNGESAPPATTPAKTPQTDLPPLQWGNGIYTVKFPQNRPLPADGVFRPPFGWKYFFYLEEAVDVPEYVVPWEGFRGLAEEYGLELLWRRSFSEVWDDYRHDPDLGPLSERMRVRTRDGRLNVTPEEMEAASFYHAFCFYKT